MRMAPASAVLATMVAAGALLSSAPTDATATGIGPSTAGWALSRSPSPKAEAERGQELFPPVRTRDGRAGGVGRMMDRMWGDRAATALQERWVKAAKCAA